MNQSIIFSAISDLHITGPQDPAYALLLKFLNSPEVSISQEIFLLGDIFDVMIGDLPEYLSLYDSFFKKTQQLLDEKKTIHFFEGNHDFHLRRLFHRAFCQRPDLISNFHYYFDGIRREFSGKTYYFGHGDDLLSNDSFYFLYRTIIRSWPFRLLAEHLLTYQAINNIAKFLSSSFGKNRRPFDSKNEKIISHYRRLASDSFQKMKIDTIIIGHSHVMDLAKLRDGQRYINLGHGGRDKQFLFAEHGNFYLKNLSL